jgi:hypothetical protein
MTPQMHELESVLQLLIAEHQKLLRQLEDQQAAMKRLDLVAMEDLVRQQELARLRIVSLEARRRNAVAQLARLHRIEEPTLAKLAEVSGPLKQRLLALRDQLKAAMTQVSSRAHISGRLATSVLGHLNTVVRLLAGVVEQAGLYTKQGIPQVSGRIGMLEAIG